MVVTISMPATSMATDSKKHTSLLRVLYVSTPLMTIGNGVNSVLIKLGQACLRMTLVFAMISLL